MKRKHATGIIAFLSAIVLSAVFAGCTPKVERYSVSVEYDSSLGAVTVTNDKGEPATEFAAGSTVTVTATPIEGYALVSVIINNEEAAIIGYSHSFTVISDTTVRVVFAVNQGTGG